MWQFSIAPLAEDLSFLINLRYIRNQPPRNYPDLASGIIPLSCLLTSYFATYLTYFLLKLTYDISISLT
jgi:hypothetical protein